MGAGVDEDRIRVVAGWNGGEIRSVPHTVSVLPQHGNPREHRIESRPRPRSAERLNDSPTHHETRLFASALDKLNRGVVLIDGAAQVWFANRAAGAMLAQRAGLSLRAGRLAFRGCEVSRRFEQFLARASDQDGGGSLVLMVVGPPQQDAYRVLVSPLEQCGSGADAAYCVFIYQPDAGNQPLPNKVLAQLYGLTPSESRLVNALFVGKPLSDAARQVGVTVNTAKSVLKKVFAKCGVASQAQLLQLLALGPRTL